MSSLKNKALDIAQRYCGMTPKDLGVDTFAQMQEKMANEIVALSNRNSMRDVVFIPHDIGTMGCLDFRLEGHAKNLDSIITKTIKTEDLIGKTIKRNKLYSNEEKEEKGKRGVTNNRKNKTRKKAKNGKNK